VKHRVKKIIAASSASIYGMADVFPAKENHHPYSNRTLYGAAKTANELVFRLFLLIYVDGKQTMDFVYEEDVARSNILALKSDANDEVFIIANGTETSLEELCFLLLKAMKSDLMPKYKPISEDRKKVEVKKHLADISKAKYVIVFKPEVSSDQGLRKLVSWLDEQKIVKVAA